MLWRKGKIMIDEKPVLPTQTGKIRAKISEHDFKYYAEEEWSNGSWSSCHSDGFSTIKEAKDWFDRAKKARRENPAMLGDWND